MNNSWATKLLLETEPAVQLRQREAERGPQRTVWRRQRSPGRVDLFDEGVVDERARHGQIQRAKRQRADLRQKVARGRDAVRQLTKRGGRPALSAA